MSIDDGHCYLCGGRMIQSHWRQDVTCYGCHNWCCERCREGSKYCPPCFDERVDLETGMIKPEFR